MKYYSTNNKSGSTVSLRQAALQGLAPDNGLYMPETLPRLSNNFIQNLSSLSFQEICFEVAAPFTQEEISSDVLQSIITKVITFDAPLVELSDKFYSLELFHGPTLAFKDFGARFMARLLGHFVVDQDQELNILVATSGDTGSAVAHGFLGVPGIKVTLLYPSGKVSHIQEMQLTTMGQNIYSLEVDGTFDDCQKLVKTAFLDSDLSKKLTMSSANSINIARLIPQAFYYFRACSQLTDKSLPLIICVPSGNFGNLTAGLIAKRLGLPVERFVAATNINRVVPDYLETGTFSPHPSFKTISNAMDVGDPSNFARMLDLYSESVSEMRKDIHGVSVSEDEIRETIKRVFKNTGYVLDPHGAVGCLGLERFKKSFGKDANCIFFETAHPAKFGDVVNEVLGKTIEIPERLEQYLRGTKKALNLSSSFKEFKEYLLS